MGAKQPSQWRERVREQRVSLAICGIVTALLSLLIHQSRLGQQLERFSYDALSSIVRPRVPEDLLIVTMDESAYQALDQDYTKIWNRSLHADLLEQLREARLVVFDVTMSDPGNEDDNRKLAQAIRAHGRVVLAAERSPINIPGVKIGAKKTITPLSIFETNAASWGLISGPSHPGIFLRIHFPGQQGPSLAQAAAELVRPRPADLKEAQTIAAKEGLPLPPYADQSTNETARYIAFVKEHLRQKRLWIAYYGPSGTIDTMSYARALEEPPEFYDDRVVFVGGSPSTGLNLQQRDIFDTPHGLMSGVEIHATMFANLIRDESLYQWPLAYERWMLLVMGLVVGTGMLWLPPLPRTIVGLLAASVILFLALYTVTITQVWFNWATMAFVLVPIGWLSAFVTQSTLKSNRRGTPLSTTILDPLSHSPFGAIVPDHALRRCLRRGAYSELWLSQDAAGAPFAIKIAFRDRFVDDASYQREFNAMKRFMEVAALHPALLPVLDIGQKEAGYFYCVMKAADDEQSGQKIDPDRYKPRSLAWRIHHQGKLAPDECVRMGIDLAAALRVLHGQRLIHRNIKPSNILYVEGAPLLAETSWQRPVSKTRHESSTGSESFRAPEGADSETADIYSLGMSLYAALTGQAPERFPEPPSSATDTRDISLVNHLTKILVRACHKAPAHRYASAAELHGDLLQARIDYLHELEHGQEGPEGGQMIPDHEMIRAIGRGAYGQVWLTRNRVGIYNAAKIVRRDALPEDSYEREFRGIERFMPISALHPGFLRLLHVGRDDRAGYFFYTMELGDDQAEGETIDPDKYTPRTLDGEVKRRGPLSTKECLRLMIDLTSPLQLLHEKGLIHRDIKTANIVYVRGVAKLADIGLVTTIADKDKTVVIGTKDFMPPEPERSPLSDIFSMGKVLFVILSGLHAKRFPEFPTLLADRGDPVLMPELIRIMYKCCEVEVERRYQSVAELRDDLLALQTRTGPGSDLGPTRTI